MSIEKMIEEIRDRQAPWNDVREQRVFRRILEAQPSPRRYAVGVLGGIGVAAAIALVLGFSLTLGPDEDVPQQSTAKGQPEDDSSILDIVGAGQVTMMGGARVSVLNRDPKHIEILQSEGKAKYTINYQRGRQVIVYAAGVEIRVIGTEFTVLIKEEMVQVGVTEGRVQIDDGTRTVTLKYGEEIIVASPHAGKAAATPLKSSDLPELNVDSNQRVRRVAVGSSPNTDALFSEVDKARSRGDHDRAVALLHRIIGRAENRSQRASAQFILGKVERVRGRPRAAAKAFRSCLELSPKSPLAEDARAEEALSWFAAEKTEKAKAAIQAYLERYPNGIHANRLRRLVE